MSDAPGNEVAKSGQNIHERLADLVLQDPAREVADLGAGEGRTLAEVARRSPGSALTAIDLDDAALATLSTTLPHARTLRHDLAEGLPMTDRSVDVVVSHNTLECLLDPAPLLDEIARVLRPRGRVVLGHTDFETIVVATADRELSRRVLLTYAELPVLYRHMATADAQMGRRLAGLVRRSSLQLETVRAHTTVLPTLAEAQAARLTEVAMAVERSARGGLGHVTVAEIQTWTDQLEAAERDGDFLFSETAYLLTATANSASPLRSSAHRTSPVTSATRGRTHQVNPRGWRFG
jgi:ubiquinone/menaquinone biosynthesis C-methylase UbiE